MRAVTSQLWDHVPVRPADSAKGSRISTDCCWIFEIKENNLIEHTSGMVKWTCCKQLSARVLRLEKTYFQGWLDYFAHMFDLAPSVHFRL